MKKIKMFSLAFILMFALALSANAEECTQDSVAKIGNDCYNSIQEAINVVENDGNEVTITILKDLDEKESAGGIGLFRAGKVIKVGEDVVYNATPATNKNIILDFDGHTVQMGKPLIGSNKTESQNLHFEKGNTVTLKNGTVIASSEAKMLLQNYCNLTLIDFTLDGSKSSSSYTSSNNNGVVKMLGNTNIYAPEGKVAFDVYWWPKNTYVDGTQVTVDITGTIKGKIEVDTDGTEDSKSTLTIKNGNFEGDIAVTKGLEKNVVISGGTFSKDVDSTLLADEYITEKVEEKYIVKPNTTIETENSDVVFESEEPFSSKYKLLVEGLNEEETTNAETKLEEAYKNNKNVENVKLVAIYNISVTDGANKIPMENGKFTITISIDDSAQNYDTYKVIYINDQGEIEEILDAKLVDGNIVFTTTHLSTYGVVGYNNVNPNTGDNITMYLIIGMLSLIVCTITFNKLRRNA